VEKTYSCQGRFAQIEYLIVDGAVRDVGELYYTLAASVWGDLFEK
jgi:hypothetical protein